MFYSTWNYRVKNRKFHILQCNTKYIFLLRLLLDRPTLTSSVIDDELRKSWSHNRIESPLYAQSSTRASFEIYVDFEILFHRHKNVDLHREACDTCWLTGISKMLTTWNRKSPLGYIVFRTKNFADIESWFRNDCDNSFRNVTLNSSNLIIFFSYSWKSLIARRRDISELWTLKFSTEF